MHYAIDIVLLVLIVIITLRGRKKGFIRMLLETLGFAVSAVVAWIVANKFSKTIYESYFRQGVLSNIEDRMTGSGSPDAGTVSFYSIPNQLRGIAEKLGFSVEQLTQNTVNADSSNPGDAAAVIEKTVVSPIALIVLKIVLFLITMIVCSLVLKFIIGIIDRASKLPVLKTANGTLGAIFGLLNGLIVATVISLLLFTAAGFINNESFTSEISKTYSYKAIQYFGKLIFFK